MNSYTIILVILGAASLGMAWMPAITKKFKISYSVLYVTLGFVVYNFIEALQEPNPTKEVNITLRLTELVVIVSLMGTGLKIDEPFSFRDWSIPLRLVSITMLLSIGITALLGFYWLGFSIPSAILLGAALAPTDPVLASDVQVGPPLEKTKSRVRFVLTAEGGLNDGMAFPFTWLAIALVASSFTIETLTSWVLMDLVFRIGVGVIIGLLFGKGLAYLLFHLPKKTKLDTPATGLSPFLPHCLFTALLNFVMDMVLLQFLFVRWHYAILRCITNSIKSCMHSQIRSKGYWWRLS